MARKAKTDGKYLAGHKKIFGYKYLPQQDKIVLKNQIIYNQDNLWKP
jgi:hypothetical protein